MRQYHDDALSEEQRREVKTKAAEHILGPNPVVGVRRQDLFRTEGQFHTQVFER